MAEFGTLTRIDLRDGWRGEAGDFTPWLADNLAQLGDALGMDLELVAQEAPVGSFSLDILARDTERGWPVVIENQLEPTDHDHLGKLLTYAAGYDASVAVWVTADFREGHRQALDWLNQRTDGNTGFFGVVVELLRIDDSLPAVNFRVVASPNDWSKAAKASSAAGAPSDRAMACQAFFEALVDQLREEHKFTNIRVVPAECWRTFASGHSGIRYGAGFSDGDRLRAEVYIRTRSETRNKALFDRLYAQREEIERAFGEPLTWERSDNRKTSRVVVYRTGNVMVDEVAQAELRAWLVDHLLRLKTVFDPVLAEAIKHLSALTIETGSSMDETD